VIAASAFGLLALLGVLAGRLGGAAGQAKGHTRLGLGAELVLDLVGAGATLALAAQVATPKGAVAIVGLAGDTLPVAFGQLPLECSVAIPYWGSRSELMEVIALAQAGRIQPEVERFGLAPKNPGGPDGPDQPAVPGRAWPQ
jgi:D-arabinose 1-dehydrogenase-like Zn-dependent alcohol dehydrogenase